VWLQVPGGETVVGGGPRVSSGGGRAMAALGMNEGPTKDEKGLKTEAPMVDGGETMGGLKAKPGGAPVSTAPFPEMESNPAVVSWVEIGPTKVWGGEGVEGVHGWCATANDDEIVVGEGAATEWFFGGTEGGRGKPTQVDARNGRRAACASAVKWNGGMVMDRKGGQASPPKPIPGSDGY